MQSCHTIIVLKVNNCYFSIETRKDQLLYDTFHSLGIVVDLSHAEEHAIHRIDANIIKNKKHITLISDSETEPFAKGYMTICDEGAFEYLSIENLISTISNHIYHQFGQFKVRLESMQCQDCGEENYCVDVYAKNQHRQGWISCGFCGHIDVWGNLKGINE